MRKPIYLGAEARLCEYGKLAIEAHVPVSFVTYTLPGKGASVDEVVYVRPEGEEFQCLEYAYKALEGLQQVPAIWVRSQRR